MLCTHTAHCSSTLDLIKMNAVEGELCKQEFKPCKQKHARYTQQTNQSESETRIPTGCAIVSTSLSQNLARPNHLRPKLLGCGSAETTPRCIAMCEMQQKQHNTRRHNQHGWESPPPATLPARQHGARRNIALTHFLLKQNNANICGAIRWHRGFAQLQNSSHADHGHVGIVTPNSKKLIAFLQNQLNQTTNVKTQLCLSKTPVLKTHNALCAMHCLFARHLPVASTPNITKHGS